MTAWSEVGKLNGYVDVEIQAPRTAKREEVLERAILALGVTRGRPWSRTRVTNLWGGQWAVRFYR